MILDELFEDNSLPSHIKKSDLPPSMRAKLTMKDVEAERPQGAYRFRVGEKEFMDLAAAKEFAAGTGEKVVPIREEKKSSNPRIEKILKQLRARYPQAQDDLEALVYDMRAGQRQDRTDINRLDAENDAEEAEIADIEQMIKSIRARRSEIAEKKKMSAKDDPCWSGYHMVGTKMKNGREVPNCVPGEKGSANESTDGQYAVRVQRDADEMILR